MQMVMSYATSAADVILAQEFQKHLSDKARKYRVIDKGKCKKQ